MRDLLEYFREKLKEVPREIYIFFSFLAVNFPVLCSLYIAEDHSKILFVISALIVVTEACLSGYAIDKIFTPKTDETPTEYYRLKQWEKTELGKTKDDICSYAADKLIADSFIAAAKKKKINKNIKPDEISDLYDLAVCRDDIIQNEQKYVNRRYYFYGYFSLWGEVVKFSIFPNLISNELISFEYNQDDAEALRYYFSASFFVSEEQEKKLYEAICNLPKTKKFIRATIECSVDVYEYLIQYNFGYTREERKDILLKEIRILDCDCKGLIP